MAFYLKIKNNTRLLNPGDYFIGADGINHTYNELENLSALDLSVMGVYYLSISELPVYRERIMLSQIEEQRDLRIISSFYFKNINYTCTLSDITNTTAQLSLLNTLVPNPTAGNTRWLVPDAPFHVVDAHGELHEFDALTFIEFAKAMTLHSYTHKICAEILKIKVITYEINVGDSIYWPNPAIPHEENYKLFSNELIDLKYLNANKELLTDIEAILSNNA